MTVTINTEPLEVCPLCGTDDILYPSVAKEYRAEIELLNRAADLQAENERLRDALEIIAKAKGDLDKIVCLATIKYCADIAKDAIEATKEGE